MPTHNHHDNKADDHELNPQGMEVPDAAAGYERSDVRVKGVVVFMVAMGIFVVVTALLSYGIGKVLFAHMKKEDGPKSKWATMMDLRSLGNLPNNPELQKKMETVTQQFPAPRLQTDDGSQDVADLHEREDLLLENYSWVNQAQGKVRIPIERAMALIAQSGLPVAPQKKDVPLMTGETNPAVAVPLTNGFARTGFELDEAQAKDVNKKRADSKK